MQANEDFSIVIGEYSNSKTLIYQFSEEQSKLVVKEEKELSSPHFTDDLEFIFDLNYEGGRYSWGSY